MTVPCCPFLPLCSDIRDTYITLRVFPEGQQCNWMRPSSDLKADQLIDGAECKTTRTCPVLLPFFATCEPRPAVSTRPRFARNHFFYASRVRVPAPGENANYFPWLVRDSRAQKSAVDQREDRRVDAYRHCQRTNRDGAKSTRLRQQPQSKLQIAEHANKLADVCAAVSGDRRQGVDNAESTDPLSRPERN